MNIRDVTLHVVAVLCCPALSLRHCATTMLGGDLAKAVADGVGKLAAWFVLDSVVPNSNK